MGQFNPQPGVEFMLDSKPYVITAKIDDQTCACRNKRDNGERLWTVQEMLRFINEERMYVVVNAMPDEPPPIVWEEGFTDQELAIAKFRLSVVERIKGKSKREIKYLCAEMKANGVKKISPSTVYKWQGMLRDAFGDWLALVPKDRNKGRGHDWRLDPAVLKVMDQLIADHANQRNKYSVVAMYDLLPGRIAKENRKREKEGLKPLTVPHISSVRKRMHATLTMKTARARYGKEKAFNKFCTVGQISPTTYPHERWQVDHTPLDVIIIDPETGKPIGKPYLTAIIDAFSDYIVGFYIGLESPSYESVMYALECAIDSKEWIKEKYPEIEHEWYSYGLPELLITDNGPEFHSKSFTDMLLRLAFPRKPCLPKTPWHKPEIERFFHTVNMGLIHFLPGTTFSNVQERKGYDSDKHACLTLEDVRKYFLSWLLRSYHVTRNRGVKGTPEKLYRDGIPLTPPSIPSNSSWKKTIGKLEKRKLQREGIEIFNEVYPLSAELTELRMELLRAKRVDEDIIVKYDPRDISILYVLNPFTRKFVMLQHPNSKLHGCSEFMYKYKQRMKGANDPTNQQSRAEHQEDVEAWIKKAKKAKKRQERRSAARAEESVEQQRAQKDAKPKKGKVREEVRYDDDYFDFGGWGEEV